MWNPLDKLAKPVWSDPELNSLAKALGYGQSAAKRRSYDPPAFAVLFGFFSGVMAIGGGVSIILWLTDDRREHPFLLAIGIALLLFATIAFGIAQIINCIGRTAHYSEEIADMIAEQTPPQNTGVLLGAILEEARKISASITQSHLAEPAEAPGEPEPDELPGDDALTIPCPCCEAPVEIPAQLDRNEYTCPACGDVFAVEEEPA